MMNSNHCSSDGSSSLEPSHPPSEEEEGDQRRTNSLPTRPQDPTTNAAMTNRTRMMMMMNGSSPNHPNKGSASEAEAEAEAEAMDGNQQHQHHIMSSSSSSITNGGAISTTAEAPQQHAPTNSNSSTTYADAVMNGIHDPMTNLAVHSPPVVSAPLPQVQEQPLQFSLRQDDDDDDDDVGIPPSIPPIPILQQQQQQQQLLVEPATMTQSLFSQAGGQDTSEGGNSSFHTDNNDHEDGGDDNDDGRSSRMSIEQSFACSETQETRRAMSVDLTTNTDTRANTTTVSSPSPPSDGGDGAMIMSLNEEQDFMMQDNNGHPNGNGNHRGSSISSSSGTATATSATTIPCPNNPQILLRNPDSNQGGVPGSSGFRGASVVVSTSSDPRQKNELSIRAGDGQNQLTQSSSSSGGGGVVANTAEPRPNVDDPNNSNNPSSSSTAATAADSGMTLTMGMEATAAHERRQNNVELTTPLTTSSTKKKERLSFSKSYLRAPEHTLERLSYILGRGSLVMINFSQRNLGYRDAELIRSAILSNPQLSVLKLGYNNLGNVGANLIASAIHCGGDDGAAGLKVGEDQRRLGLGEKKLDNGEQVGHETHPQQHQQRQQRHRHHPSLSVLDLGFNNIGDEGCTSLATLAVARNPALSTLYLSGNAVREKGALSLAEVVAQGCGLTSLHLTANRIGPRGVKGLMRSMAEFDVTMQMAHQDRENRMALEEEQRKMRESLGREDMEKRKSENGGNDVDLESMGINDDGNDNDEGNNNEEPDDLARLRGFQCMEELYLGGTHMESTGCLSVSNMLLTNLSLRTICLSDNGLNDQDLSLFSQSLSRNRELPLETLRLSFNKLTCVGVETLMNAIWGSKTLREIKLDNNQIRDRGAQLAAVVLTSVDLEVLDVGFNRLTIVGIKALMKSLAENRSLLTLTLSGNVLDTNASKAVSYALAYNKTIHKLYVDHCSLSYAAQRHIAAGIVSNSNLALRVMSGFPLGAISVTLGLPGAMETWSNEQVLKFIRVMWDRFRHEKEAKDLASSKDSTQSMSTAGRTSEAGSVNAGAVSEKSAEKPEQKSGPSDPATVVAAAKSAFEALGDAGGALLLTEEPQRAISESSPMVSSDAVMLEKTPSGTIRVPSLDESDDESSFQTNDKPNNVPLDMSNTHISTDSLCTANGTLCPDTPMDPAAKKRNMEWLRLHFRSLNEMTQLPYVHADLLQLYRYFYSPGDNAIDEDSSSLHDGMPPPQLGLGFNPGITSSTPPKKPSGMQRKISYRGLHDVMMGQSHQTLRSPNVSIENTSKRRLASDPTHPATKRARSGKPRIDHFPRLKAIIEQYVSSSKQTKALVLLRQLKFVETTMFHGGHPYCDQSTTCSNSSEPIATDAEVILIDML